MWEQYCGLPHTTRVPIRCYYTMTRHVHANSLYDAKHTYLYSVERVHSKKESLCRILGTTHSIPPVGISSNPHLRHYLTEIRLQNLQIWCWPANRFVGIRYQVCLLVHLPDFGSLMYTFRFRRKPAWTDRILHLPSPSVSVQQLSYSGHPLVAMSDHRPVSADFSVQVGFAAPCLSMYLTHHDYDTFCRIRYP